MSADMLCKLVEYMLSVTHDSAREQQVTELTEVTESESK